MRLPETGFRATTVTPVGEGNEKEQTRAEVVDDERLVHDQGSRDFQRDKIGETRRRRRRGVEVGYA